jgi:hypothetical protein
MTRMTRWTSSQKRPQARGQRRVVAVALAFATLAAVGRPGAQAPVPAPDDVFKDPYVDVDEWRDTPVRHRYVHGGFKGTDTRFSIYLPPKEQYQGRFFQHITPVPDNENLAQKIAPGAYNKIGFAMASGAYFLETNGGGHLDLGKAASAPPDPTITAYRANAASAQYSRVVAVQMYGGKRPFGYAYGGSGGAYRTVGSFENTTGVWDGVVPYVLGSTMAIPNMFTVRIRALRILKDRFPQVVDAVEPGGSGDPYAGLTEEQAGALREVTRMGFPLPSWFGHETMGIHGFAALYQGVLMADPSYFTDFWTNPGYLGFDHPEQFRSARLQHGATVASAINGAEAARLRLNTDASSGERRGGVDAAFLTPEQAGQIVAFRLDPAPPKVDFLGGDLRVLTGAAAGKSLPLARVVGEIVVLGIADSSVVATLKPGDTVQVDNSNFLAAETYHRHQVPGPEFAVWNQFRRPDGKPVYPQRPMLLGPLFVRATAGSLMTGKFDGKMIVLESLWDREAMPWQGDWYRALVRANLGDKTDDHFRLWYTDHALHGDDPAIEDATRVVSYQGALQQALRDLAAWVEQGVAPAATTNYRIEDGQVTVPAAAAERRGIQPVVSLRVHGGAGAEVAVGQRVRFVGSITVAPGGGSIVGAEWDFDGRGVFPLTSTIAPRATSATIEIEHVFDTPGTYFPALRGTSQRQGDRATPYARISNLGRARVVVK